MYNLFYSKLIINFVNTIPVVFSLYIPAANPRSHKYILHLKTSKLNKHKTRTKTYNFHNKESFLGGGGVRERKKGKKKNKSVF